MHDALDLTEVVKLSYGYRSSYVDSSLKKEVGGYAGYKKN